MKTLLKFALICILVAASAHLAIQMETVNVGVIVDSTSYSGKIAKAALKLAVDDVNRQTEHTERLNGIQLFLHLREARTPLEIASAAVGLLGEEVVAIIETQTSETAPFVSDLGEAANVPILSLSSTSPAFSRQRFPYFVRMAHGDQIQMKAVAALLNHYGWRNIAFLHSDDDFGSGALSAFRDAVRDLDSEIIYAAMIPSTAEKQTIREELYKLKDIKSSIFVVHSPCDLGVNLFMEAKEMGMMEAGYVWITTKDFTSVWDYVLNVSTMSSMQGLLGVKTHIPNSKKMIDFTERWERQFRHDNPNMKSMELNTYGLLAYDTVHMITRAIKKMERNARLSFLEPSTPLALMTDTKIKVFQQGGKLLEEIFSSNFAGFSGPVKFHYGDMCGSTYEIVNVVGKSYQTIGYWPFNSSKLFKNLSLASEGLRFVIWPGGLSTVPRNWVSPTRLKIAVPVTEWEQLYDVSFESDSNTTTVTGFIIDVFHAVVKRLDYQLQYDFIPLDWRNNTYDELVRLVYLKKFDAIVGDVTVRANRSEIVDFTQPFTQTGLVIVARTATTDEANNGWTFLQPFTRALWATTVVFVLYTGFVVWLLEHKINPDFRGSPINQVVTLLWFTFCAMFFAHQERIHNSLTRIVVAVWLFVVFILTASYTANLASRLTAEQIAPVVNDNYKVGYHGSLVGSFLKDNLRMAKKHLDRKEFEEALLKGVKNGGVDAIIDEIPYVRAFLSGRCGYSIIGRTYISGGFGFVFPKASPLVQDFSWAILNLSDIGWIQDTEDKYFKGSTYTCSDFPKYSKIGVRSFQELYLITGMTSSLVMIIFILQARNNFTKGTTYFGQEISMREYIKSFVNYLYQE